MWRLFAWPISTGRDFHFSLLLLSFDSVLQINLANHISFNNYITDWNRTWKLTKDSLVLLIFHRVLWLALYEVVITYRISDEFMAASMDQTKFNPVCVSKQRTLFNEQWMRILIELKMGGKDCVRLLLCELINYHWNEIDDKDISLCVLKVTDCQSITSACFFVF